MQCNAVIFGNTVSEKYKFRLRGCPKGVSGEGGGEVAPPSSKSCNLKANIGNSITFRFRVIFLREREQRGTLFITLVSIQSKLRLCVLEVATEKAPHPILAHHLAPPHHSGSLHLENCLLATHVRRRFFDVLIY